MAQTPEETERKMLEDARVVHLPTESQKRFAELLLAPVELTPAMRRAQEAHQALIQTSAIASTPD